MQVKELKQDGLSHELEVTITAKDIDSRVEKRLQEVSKNIRMPGFRPGKVPLTILKKRYGKAIMGEVLEATVNETSNKALADKKLRPAMQPKIEVKEFDDGKDLIYSLEVDVLPEFKLMDFKGIKLEKPVAKPTDKVINESLERIASSNPALEDVKTKRGAKEGDVVVIDFHGRTADDNVAHEGMHAHGHNLKLGSGQFIPGFEEQLIGKKVGDKVEVKVSFPENYGAAELAGREAIFDTEIKGLKEEGEAKIDDDFAKSLGLEDLDALKKAVSEQLEKEFETHSRMLVKKDLLDALDDGHEMDVPPKMLEIEHQNIIDQLQLEAQRSGKDKEEAELSDKEKAEYKDIAARRVRLGLILAEIGNQNNLQVSDPELNKAVIAEAQKYPGQEREVFDYYSKNRQALESLRAPLYEEKVVDFILELADIKEKKMTPDELLDAVEADMAEEEKPKAKSKKKSSSTSSKAKASEGEKKSEAKKKAPAKKKPAAKKSTAKKKS